MVKRRTGLDPLAYMGVEPQTPAQFVEDNRNPTTNDYENFNLMAVWLNRTTYQVWMLVDKADFIATWLPFSSSFGALNTLTADTGTNPVPPTANNINLFGGTGIVTVGNAGASTITIDVDFDVATQYDADIGTAIPAANILNIVGGPHVQTTGAGNTITISPLGTIAVEVPTDSGTAIPSGGMLNVFGGDNISTSGSGNTVTIAVSGTTDHAVQIGNAAGSLTSIAVGLDGQVVIGATAADPAFAFLTSVGGTIAFTTGPNSLNLETVGAGFLTDIVCDVGDAAPIGGILNVLGGDNITTTGDTMNTITVAVSGTGQYAPQMGNAAGSLTDIGFMTDGTLIIGQTGLAPVINTLTAGTGITITNGPGSITIDATGGSTGGVKITTFNASGTFIKDANSKMIYYLLVSSGGGGGSGARRASGTATSGGAGGGVQGTTVYMIPSDHLGATENVTIAAGSLGGAPVLVDNTNGNFSESPSVSYFGTTYPMGGGWLYQNAPGFNIAVGGSTSTAQGSGVGQSYYFTDLVQDGLTIAKGGTGNVGAAGGIGATGFVGLNYMFIPLPGGGGGGISVGGTAFKGGDGAIIALPEISGSELFIGTAAAGGNPGVSGVNGDDATAVKSPFCGAGFGAGGGGSHATNPGHGGNGGFPGGGGGGGGSVLNGNPSGAGGDGGDGQLIVYEFLGS